MTIETFPAVQGMFETPIARDYKFQLLELHYLSYSFGSGLLVYRIKGKNLKIIYDGRDCNIDLSISESHQKYPECSWNSKFYGKVEQFKTIQIKDYIL